MDQRITSAAAAIIAPRLIGAFRLRWLIYGAAAYFGLRYMSKRGILPDQANAALNMIDQGFGFAKKQISDGASGLPGRDFH